VLSAGGPAAVDDDRLSGDIASGVADEPQDRADDVVGGPLLGQRGAAAQVLGGALTLVERAGDLARQTASGITVGDPRGDFVMGSVVSGAQFEKIQALIQKGIDEGATLVAGGTGRPDGLEKGYYVKPTVFARVANDMTVAREEIFGPVVTILGYDSVDHAAEIANDTEYGLAGYVAGADLEKARAVARCIRAGVGRVRLPGIPGDQGHSRLHA
jgi:acyl-CoA reductase-like NAD-dependent aldehyde dehydrogenase